VTDRESNPRPLGRMTGDSTTRLKRSAVMSGTGIHRLIYRDICVERGASYAGCAAHNTLIQRELITLVLRFIMNDRFSFDSSIAWSESSQVSWVNRW